jgi:hypothetical protein
MLHTRQLDRTLLLVLALFITAMLAITGYTLARSHAEAIANNLEISAMHTRSFETFLTQSLHLTEILATNAEPQDVDDEALRQSAQGFITTLRHRPSLRSMSLQDEHGRIVASSNPANVGLLVATQDYLPLTNGQPAILRIGRPWSGGIDHASAGAS